MNNAPITPKPARKGRKFLGWSITVVAAIMIIGGALLGDDETPAPETVTAEVERPEAAPEPEAKEPIAEPEAEPAEPEFTVSQEQALISADSYLLMGGFSRSGLIGQLEYEDFSTDDATFAVDALDVDWNEQAALSAASYMEMGGFSAQGLLDQLLYEGFTQDEAEHGVGSVGF